MPREPFDPDLPMQINARDRMEHYREHITHNRNPWASMMPKKGSTMARQVQKEVAGLIRQGCVVMTHKTKLAHEGGRQLVSVGPYRTATSRSRSFALITKHDQLEYGSAVTAAKRFIEFVGRARAGEAALRAASRCGRR